MGDLDLSELDDWDDHDVMGALEEIGDGLTENNLVWIERLRIALGRGDWSYKQRGTAESILKRWNERDD